MGDFDTCTLCPRLCRSACPVVTGAAREAAAPSWIATALREWEQGRLSDDEALAAAVLCTDCGACTEHCHIGVPLPEYIRQRRAKLAPADLPEEPEVPPGKTLLIVRDQRDWAPIAQRLDAVVWRIREGMGEAAVRQGRRYSTSWSEQLLGRRLVTSDGGVGYVLGAHGVAFDWLHELIGDESGVGSCCVPGMTEMACCGGAGPLAKYHPDDAARVGQTWAERCGVEVRDSRCREHLRASGIQALDLLDRLSS